MLKRCDAFSLVSFYLQVLHSFLMHLKNQDVELPPMGQVGDKDEF